MSPIVSIVTATRNRTDLLARALRSIARQTLGDFEAIVVDDGSSADVVEHHDQLMNELGDRFRLLKPSLPGARGTGPAAARNRGVQAARGQFVAFLDDDDEWVADDYLETAARSLNCHDADYLFAHLQGDRDGELQNPGWVPDERLLVGSGAAAGNDAEVKVLSRKTVLLIARRFMIHPSNSIVRQSVLQRIGGFFEGLWSHAEDLNLMLRVLDVARRVLYLPKFVTRYRLPTGNSISLSENEQMHFLQRILGAQHARLRCTDSDLQDCARAREAWTYREMALSALRRGARREAKAFARQAWCTYPTTGAAAFAFKSMFGSLGSPIRDEQPVARTASV